jgi:hypothetical protein
MTSTTITGSANSLAALLVSRVPRTASLLPATFATVHPSSLLPFRVQHSGNEISNNNNNNNNNNNANYSGLFEAPPYYYYFQALRATTTTPTCVQQIRNQGTIISLP